jgi:hypothetical protein
MLKDAWFPAVRPEMFTSWFLAFFSCWWLSGSRVWDDPFQLDQRRSQKICNSVEMAWDRDQIYIYIYIQIEGLSGQKFIWDSLTWWFGSADGIQNAWGNPTIHSFSREKRRTHCPPWYIFLIPKLYIHWKMKKKPCHQFIAAHMGSTGKLLMRSGTNPENPRSWRTKKWTHFQLAFQLQMVDFLLQIAGGYHFTPMWLK